METESSALERLHCNRCHHQTKHCMLFSKSYSVNGEVEDYGPVSWLIRYDLFECLGCEDVTLRVREQFSETPEQENEGYYPPRISRTIPQWAGRGDLPNEIRMLLLEVYKALQTDSPALALMGARAIIDLTMTHKVGSGDFKQNLRAFEAGGYLSGKNREVLEVALEAGHAASHRAYSAPSGVVATVMDIVENLLQAVFVLAKMAQDMKQQIPRRTPKGVPATGDK